MQFQCPECSTVRTISFDDIKKGFIFCTDCPNRYTQGKQCDDTCLHCKGGYLFNLKCFVQNLELHDSPRDMQVNPDVWENNRQYHILRRMLEHDKEYDEVKDEPDLYEQVHKKIGRKAFHKVWVEHEQGIKDMRDML